MGEYSSTWKTQVLAERKEQILQYVNMKGSATVKTLADFVGVSEATIRRYLQDLHDKNSLIKTHGGAVPLKTGTASEQLYDEKLNIFKEEKRRIANIAAGYINNGDTIFLDSGSTAYYLGCCLRDLQNLYVFTYDIRVAYSLNLHPTSDVFVVGGICRHNHKNVLVGSQVVSYLKTLRIDKLFLAVDALDLEIGISNSNLLEAEIKKQAVESSNTVYVISDHSKFNKIALSQVCSLEKIDTLITDSGADPNYLQLLKEKIKNVIVV